MDNTETYHQPTHISLCAGYGGIDLGLKRVLPDLRTVAYAEIECAAIELLLARMEGGSLDPAPIWSNLRTFPWSAFSDRVDVLSGGYPCQPFSSAGKRLGAEDERHLWPAIADGIRILRPRICFFENVEGHITLGLSSVLSDLEELGYEVSWGLFSASEVGAPHQRKRIFILAVADTLPEGLQGCLRESCDPGWVQQQARRGSHCFWPSLPGEPQHAWEPPRVVANTEFIGRRGRSDGDARGLCGEIQTARPCGGSAEPAVGDTGCGGGGGSKHDTSEALVDSQSERVRQRFELCEEERGSGSALPRDIEQPSATTLADPNDTSRCNGDIECERKFRVYEESGCFTGFARDDQRQAQPGSPQTEPTLGGDANGPSDWVDYGKLCVSSDNRTDELRMLGNGVCVPTAAKAFRVLSAELLGKR